MSFRWNFAKQLATSSRLQNDKIDRTGTVHGGLQQLATSIEDHTCHVYKNDRADQTSRGPVQTSKPHAFRAICSYAQPPISDDRLCAGARLELVESSTALQTALLVLSSSLVQLSKSIGGGLVGS